MRGQLGADYGQHTSAEIVLSDKPCKIVKVAPTIPPRHLTPRFVVRIWEEVPVREALVQARLPAEPLPPQAISVKYVRKSQATTDCLRIHQRQIACELTKPASTSALIWSQVRLPAVPIGSVPPPVPCEPPVVAGSSLTPSAGRSQPQPQYAQLLTLSSPTRLTFITLFELRPTPIII